MQVKANSTPKAMIKGSFEEFIFEHYYGFTKVSETVTEKYSIQHPSWMINDITETTIKCNFGDNYGSDFEFLNHTKADAVFLAEGSAISVAWKRNKI